MNLNNNDIIKVANIDKINEGKEIIAMNKKFKTILGNIIYLGL